MTDKELLELAAKAAGLRIEYWAADNYPVVLDENGRKCGWNPLVFDSDALRLTVKLEIRAGYSELSGCGYASYGRGTFDRHEYGPEDPCKATRRAITRAAAEIGRAMP